MAVSKKIRWQRLLSKLSYLHEENEYVQSIVKDGAIDFNEHYIDFCKRMNFDIDNLNEQNADRIRKMYGLDSPGEDVETTTKALADMHQQIVKYMEPPAYSTSPEQTEETADEYQMTQDEQEMYDSFNKLFRKIAMELHPDRLDPNLSTEERKKRISKFNDARAALDKKQYFILLEMAKEFNIKSPRNYAQQIRWMKKEIDKLDSSIDAGKKTYNYAFSECDTEEEKDDVVKRFMHHLFGINFP